MELFNSEKCEKNAQLPRPKNIKQLILFVDDFNSTKSPLKECILELYHSIENSEEVLIENIYSDKKELSYASLFTKLMADYVYPDKDISELTDSQKNVVISHSLKLVYLKFMDAGIGRPKQIHAKKDLATIELYTEAMTQAYNALGISDTDIDDIIINTRTSSYGKNIFAEFTEDKLGRTILLYYLYNAFIRSGCKYENVTSYVANIFTRSIRDYKIYSNIVYRSANYDPSHDEMTHDPISSILFKFRTNIFSSKMPNVTHSLALPIPFRIDNVLDGKVLSSMLLRGPITLVKNSNGTIKVRNSVYNDVKKVDVKYVDNVGEDGSFGIVFSIIV